VMQLVAFRAAGAGADTQPPTAPSGLTATRVSSSPDRSCVDGFDRQRRGDGLSHRALPGERLHQPLRRSGTSTSTRYSDTALAASTTYLYRVRATDAAGNTSSYSATASASTNGLGSAIAYVQKNYACRRARRRR